MPHSHKNFVVFGPNGRCGSHWVESILQNFYGATLVPPGPFSASPTGWIYHTNGMHDLAEMPREIRNSATLVYCYRKNYFDAAISFSVAEITGEWHHYTSKTVEPFIINCDKFTQFINTLHDHTTKIIPEKILPLFDRVIHIDFDSLVSAVIPEKYVADQLDIDYVANENYCRTDKNKNTRNYKELVLNWDELVGIYKSFTDDHRSQEAI
jgi:predicted phosphatase